jgi:hypothetical protein
VSSSYIEARNHHFEAEAPRGMRITRGNLASDKGQDADQGFLRRIHLYLPTAGEAGGSTAKLSLRVSGRGFMVEAWIPALLVSLALAWAYTKAETLLESPTSAPSLFLLLPGVIATYLSRPDRHALTSRLLSAARLTLMFSGLFALLAAGYVAFLGRPIKHTDITKQEVYDAHRALGILLALSVVALVILLVVWARTGRPLSASKKLALRWWRGTTTPLRSFLAGRYEHSFQTNLAVDNLYDKVETLVLDQVDDREGTAITLASPPFELAIEHVGGPVSADIKLQFQRLGTERSEVTCLIEAPGKGGRVLGWRFGVSFLSLQLSRSLRKALVEDEFPGSASPASIVPD